MNLFTKEIATIAGAIFTGGFFTVFVVSEKITQRKRARNGHLDQFRLSGNANVAAPTLGVRPGNILVTVRDPNRLRHLAYILEHTDTTKQDVVVMTVRLYRGSFTAPSVVDEEHMFDEYEQELFTRVVAIAEKAGKPVSLLVVPGTNAFQSIIITAQRLESSTIVAGLSNKLTAEEQGKLTGDAWEQLPEPRPRLDMIVYAPDGTLSIFHLGPHTPRLRPEDLEHLHNIWLEVTSDPEYRGLHHYDVVALALKHLQQELHGGDRKELLEALRRMASRPHYHVQGIHSRQRE
jgi:nucleotide-binding universal stress UspA family protein